VDKNDYYSILQIDTNATQEEVRAAYKRLSFLYHPDRSEHPQATRRMQLLNEAYRVLSSQEKRARYDQDRIATSAQAPIEKTSHDAQQNWMDQENQKDLERKRNKWLRNQLKVVSRLIFLMTVFFLWSLAIGQVSIPVILLFVALAIYIIASVILRVNNLVR
jgi:curved DNA-binding protein CbpA